VNGGAAVFSHVQILSRSFSSEFRTPHFQGSYVFASGSSLPPLYKTARFCAEQNDPRSRSALPCMTTEPSAANNSHNRSNAGKVLHIQLLDLSAPDLASASVLASASASNLETSRLGVGESVPNNAAAGGNGKSPNRATAIPIAADEISCRDHM
jgi:hypothetical protein